MICAADFETTTNPVDCRVWAWGITDIENPENAFEYGTDIVGFFKHLATREINDVWFHNLAFDGRFIIWKLLDLGYEWVDKNPKFMQFTTLISSKNKFYQIEMNLSGNRIKFKDSLKLFPMSVKNLAKRFNLDTSKGELDYSEYRAPGHKLTNEELDYLKRDVVIVAKALAFNVNAGMTKLTIGANAFADYKKRIGKRTFSRAFPVLKPEVDSFIRDSYRGGYTYAEPNFCGKTISGISVDYTSMYPSMMIKYPYPFGQAYWFDGQYQVDTAHPLFVQKLVCDFELKPGALPCLQLRGRGFYGNHEYVKRTVEPVELTLTSVDLELVERMYDLTVYEYRGGYKFAQTMGLFDAYIDYWGEVKNNSQGGERQLAKLMLNNLYGKFATNPDVTGKHPVMHSDGIVSYDLCPEELRDSVYIPVGTFATAYARRELVNAIMLNRERFAYCDTDSMHLVGDEEPKGIPLGNTLCHWKVEGHFDRALHLRAKTYIWDLNGNISVTCAGMPDNVKKLCNFDNFRFGFSNVENGKIIAGAGKLTPKNVPGGVVLVESPYVLKE
jgi:hypothetical protein